MIADPDDAAFPAERQDFSAAFQQLVGSVFRLSGQLLETADLLSSDLQITTGHWQTIAIIRNQPLTVSQISRRIGVTRQSARLTVQKLQQAGLVELTDNPDHRRASLVQLTPGGQAMMGKLYERQEILMRIFTDGLGINLVDVQRLTKQLNAMCDQAKSNGDATYLP